MNGSFNRKKNNIVFLLPLISGIFFIGFNIFLIIFDPSEAPAFPIFLIMGISIIGALIPFWLFNYGAFISIKENSICAKYHWFGRIDCNISDVKYTGARFNTLVIELNDGKIHTIMGIGNTQDLASYIRRNMNFVVNEEPAVLIGRLEDVRKKRKIGIIYTSVFVALIVINICATAFLTGGRDFQDFSYLDWAMFCFMGALEIAIIITTFYLGNKSGKMILPIEKLEFAIQKRTVETAPLLPGNAINVYTNENYSLRITVYGYPKEESCYYVVEEFADGYTLYDSYKSEIIDDISEIHDGFADMRDITKMF